MNDKNTASSQRNINVSQALRLARPDSFQNKSYGPTLNSMKNSTANPKESVLKFAHPSLYVSKVKSAISTLSWLLVDQTKGPEGTKSI